MASRYERRIGPVEAAQGLNMALQSFAQNLQVAQERQKYQRENMFITDLSAKLMTAKDQEEVLSTGSEFMGNIGKYGVTDPSRPLALILQAAGSKKTKAELARETAQLRTEELKPEETQTDINLKKAQIDKIRDEIDKQPSNELKVGQIIDLYRSTPADDVAARKAILGKLKDVAGFDIPLTNVTGDESTDLLLSLVKTTANSNPEFANSAISILRKDERFKDLPNIPIDAGKDKLDQISKAVNLKALIAADPDGVDPTGNIGKAVDETLTGLGVDTGKVEDISPAKTWYDSLTPEQKAPVDAWMKAKGKTLDDAYLNNKGNG